MSSKPTSALHPYQRANRLDAAEAQSKKREAQRAHARGSWWTQAAAPDARQRFIDIARARHLEREAEKKLPASSSAAGIGLWNRDRRA